MGVAGAKGAVEGVGDVPILGVGPVAHAPLDRPSAGVRIPPLRGGARALGDVRVLERGAYAADVCAGLAVRRAWEAVEAVAADTAARAGVRFVQVDPDREVKRLVARPHEVVVELLYTRLMRDGGVGERRGAWRFG